MTTQYNGFKQNLFLTEVAMWACITSKLWMLQLHLPVMCLY